MIQGGCPEGTGTGGPGYQFEDEFNDHKVERGALAMANAGPNTNGSQFFIVTTDAAPWLDGKHTVFGKVTSGQDVADTISMVERDGRDMPMTPGHDRPRRAAASELRSVARRRVRLGCPARAPRARPGRGGARRRRTPRPPASGRRPRRPAARGTSGARAPRGRPRRRRACPRARRGSRRPPARTPPRASGARRRSPAPGGRPCGRARPGSAARSLSRRRAWFSCAVSPVSACSRRRWWPGSTTRGFSRSR